MLELMKSELSGVGGRTSAIGRLGMDNIGFRGLGYGIMMIDS